MVLSHLAETRLVSLVQLFFLPFQVLLHLLEKHDLLCYLVLQLGHFCCAVLQLFLKSSLAFFENSFQLLRVLLVCQFEFSLELDLKLVEEALGLLLFYQEHLLLKLGCFLHYLLFLLIDFVFFLKERLLLQF